MNKRMMCAALACAVFLCGTKAVYATPAIDDLKKQKQETEQQLKNKNSEIGGLQNNKDEVEEEIEEKNEELVQTMASISMLEDEIENLKEQIRIKQEEYEAAKAKEEAQYHAMVARIRFMYEKGDATYVELLLQAESFSDMLNKADYVEELYEYDRRMLEEYQAAKEAVAEAKQKLEEAKSEAEAAQAELEEEKAHLEELIAEKEAEAADYATQISRARQEAAAYKAKIQQQNQQIKKLEEEERKRREEEARRKAAASGSGGFRSPGVTSGSSSYTVPQISGSGTGADIARYAAQFVGNPYVAGGTSLTNGADCSGFTWAVYQHFGYSIPRTSGSQRNVGREVSYSEAQPGDIICYPGHVAVYIGGGRIVHASTPATGIKVSNATYRPMLTIRRLV